jgi:ribosome-binding factor A
MKSLRPRRLAVQIKRELSNILLTEFRTVLPAMTTITDVQLTPDLREARVYYSVMGTSADKIRVENILNKWKGRLRSLLAARISLRFHPSLEFRLDETLEYALRIEELIDQTHRGQPPDQSSDELKTS